MSNYRRKPIEVDAIQWFYDIKHPSIDEEDLVEYNYTCSLCGNPGLHGIVRGIDHDWVAICPGDWIVTDPNGVIDVVNNIDFIEQYDKIII